MIRTEGLELHTDIDKIIEKLRIELLKQGKVYFSEARLRSEYLSVTCPYHSNGQEKHPSAGFRRDNGFFNCFACSEKHKLTEVIEYCFDKPSGFGHSWLRDNFMYAEYEEGEKRTIPKLTNFANNQKTLVTLGKEYNEYRLIHPYMLNRGISKETLIKYDIGFDPKSSCILFPNKDENGNTVFIARRSIKNKFFIYPKNVDKPIYGLYEVNKYFPDTTHVIICESMINCLTLITWGYPAIALNGTGSANQIKKLKYLPYRKYILALDGDEAGDKGTNKLKNALRKDKLLERYVIPRGKDINDLTYEEFLALKKEKL